MITGVALGAINAYILATHKLKWPNSETQDVIDMLNEFWMELAQMDPYKMWTGGYIYGFFFEKGIYSLDPMVEFLVNKFAERKVQNHLNIAVTNVLNGK